MSPRRASIIGLFSAGRLSSQARTGSAGVLTFRENQSTMDRIRGALSPLATGFRLKAHKPEVGAVSCHGEWVNELAEELKWSLTRRREGLSDLSRTNQPPRNGFGEVDRIIHHIR